MIIEDVRREVWEIVRKACFTVYQQPVETSVDESGPVVLAATDAIMKVIKAKCEKVGHDRP